MVRTAIDDPWRPDDDPGRQPEPLDQWVASGFAVEEAEIWRSWRFRLQSADAWCGAGVLDGLQAAQWSAAGVTTNTVGQWRNAGIEASEAITWHEFGYGFEQARRNKAKGVTPAEAYFALKPPSPQVGTSPNPTPRAAPRPFPFVPGPTMARAMQQFMQSGVPPDLLHSYFQCQWTDNEAMAWAREGIDVPDAELCKAIGLRPGEAARLVQHGSSVSDAVLGWWRAGIPVDEVADWVGAGLSAAEAAEQRARGATAEQAAALRALRDEPVLRDTPVPPTPMNQPLFTVRAVARSRADLGNSLYLQGRAGEGRPEPLLARREVEVLQMLANGASSSDVAKKLFISAKTVKNHLAHIYSKLGATNRGQAVAKAVRLGIVRID